MSQCLQNATEPWVVIFPVFGSIGECSHGTVAAPQKTQRMNGDGLTITLASDADRSVLTAYGAFGEKKLYGKTVEGVIRSTFVVDEDGRIEVAQYNVKATGHVAKLRRDLGLAS